MLVGSALKALSEQRDDGTAQFLIPLGCGADSDGQYARAVRTILDRNGYTQCPIVSPILEETEETARDPELLFRAMLTADVLYAAPVGASRIAFTRCTYLREAN